MTAFLSLLYFGFSALFSLSAQPAATQTTDFVTVYAGNDGAVTFRVKASLLTHYSDLAYDPASGRLYQLARLRDGVHLRCWTRNPDRSVEIRFPAGRELVSNLFLHNGQLQTLILEYPRKVVELATIEEDDRDAKSQPPSKWRVHVAPLEGTILAFDAALEPETAREIRARIKKMKWELVSTFRQHSFKLTTDYDKFLIHVQGFGFVLAWTPDRSRIAYAERSGGELKVSVFRKDDTYIDTDVSRVIKDFLSLQKSVSLSGSFNVQSLCVSEKQVLIGVHHGAKSQVPRVYWLNVTKPDEVKVSSVKKGFLARTLHAYSR